MPIIWISSSSFVLRDDHKWKDIEREILLMCCVVLCCFFSLSWPQIHRRISFHILHYNIMKFRFTPFSFRPNYFVAFNCICIVIDLIFFRLAFSEPVQLVCTNSPATHIHIHTDIYIDTYFYRYSANFRENMMWCTFLATTDSFVWPTHENRTWIWMWMSLLCILIIRFFKRVSSIMRIRISRKITLFHWYIKRRLIFSFNFHSIIETFCDHISIRSHWSLLRSLISNFHNYEIHWRICSKRWKFFFLW